MIEFIICEDEKNFAIEYKKIIDKFMMKSDHEYKCHWFKGYSKEWTEMAKNQSNYKIYLIDIKTEIGSGLDAARKIREEYDDWNSMIIIITSYNEYKFDVLGKRLLIVDFINKLDNYKKRLESALEIALKNYDNRPKSIKYSYKNFIYNIDMKDIIYIEKEADSKRCIIYTYNKEEIPYQGTISKLMEILDNRFLQVSRSTIINLEQIKYYNTKNTEVVFKNNCTIYSISRDKKKDLLKHVRGLE